MVVYKYVVLLYSYYCVNKKNLLGQNQQILLPEETYVNFDLNTRKNLWEIAITHPYASIVWAVLAENALTINSIVSAYAYSRTGYHRGLDKLRKNGWKGFELVPFSHRPNRGFLRCLAALISAARHLNEIEEYQRCLNLINSCDPLIGHKINII